MGTKNLYENGPNPFFLFGTKSLVIQQYILFVTKLPSSSDGLY